MNNIISFAAHNAEIGVHYHHCFQLVVSLTHKFSCNIDGKMHNEISGFIVNQGVKHSCVSLN